jgi:hypothetical protein
MQKQQAATLPQSSNAYDMLRVVSIISWLVLIFDMLVLDMKHMRGIHTRYNLFDFSNG